MCIEQRLRDSAESTMPYENRSHRRRAEKVNRARNKWRGNGFVKRRAFRGERANGWIRSPLVEGGEKEVETYVRAI